MLKAEIVARDGEDAIYFKKNKDRTITLQKCIDVIFTDLHNPIKKNLVVIQRLRNKSTHFITPEYDELYISVFQANVIYYVEHIKKVFNIDLNKELPSNFLTIAANPKSLSDVAVINRIDKSAFKQFIKEKKNLQKNESYDGVCVSFEVRMKAVKKNPDYTYKIDPNAELSAQVINKVIDPSNTHPYRQKDIIDIINKEFGEHTLNQYSFRALRLYEGFEDNLEYFYYHKQSKSKTYSEKALNIIRKNIQGTPHYIEIVICEFKKKQSQELENS